MSAEVYLDALVQIIRRVFKRAAVKIYGNAVAVSYLCPGGSEFTESLSDASNDGIPRMEIFRYILSKSTKFHIDCHNNGDVFQVSLVFFFHTPQGYLPTISFYEAREVVKLPSLDEMFENGWEGGRVGDVEPYQPLHNISKFSDEETIREEFKHLCEWIESRAERKPFVNLQRLRRWENIKSLSGTFSGDFGVEVNEPVTLGDVNVAHVLLVSEGECAFRHTIHITGKKKDDFLALLDNADGVDFEGSFENGFAYFGMSFGIEDVYFS